MTKRRNFYIITTILFSLTWIGVVKGQSPTKENSFDKSIKSSILNENRKILIYLPDSYENSNQSYPVMYRLDGSTELMQETISDINKTSGKEGNTPEMIVIAIENLERSKDMWPTHTMYYPKPQKIGSPNFLSFIEKELIPYIENNYRTSKQRIICGQSLSAVFTLYAFLSKPYLFDSYICCSGAFPDCEPFFNELSKKAFRQAEKFEHKKIFITHGLKDELDQDGNIHRQMTDFSKAIKSNFGEKFSCKYRFYENEGHVPANSFIDGLTYLFKTGV